MSKTKRVCVTADDIRLGVPRSLGCCPIALALRRIPKVENHQISVGRLQATLMLGLGSWSGPITVAAILPEKARQFVHDFDNGGSAASSCRPFEFDLVFKRRKA